MAIQSRIDAVSLLIEVEGPEDYYLHISIISIKWLNATIAKKMKRKIVTPFTVNIAYLTEHHQLCQQKLLPKNFLPDSVRL